MNTKKIQKYLLKLKDSFLEESEENKKMLDVYIKSIEGEASDDEIDYANNQLNQIFKSLGLGVLTVLPFSPDNDSFCDKESTRVGHRHNTELV